MVDPPKQTPFSVLTIAEVDQTMYSFALTPDPEPLNDRPNSTG